MCAIAGGKNRKEIEKMLETMKHRAPDETGVFEDDRFVIGMGRLAIIDLQSRGLCPYQEEGFVLSFNGEIYNYVELRQQLKNLGWEFKTASDTEVLLKSYRQWGMKCLDKLNGMFAFAIYDGKKVFLARDIAGEKPLYFTEKPFRFASEAKALDFQCEELEPASWMLYDLETKTLKKGRWWIFEPRFIDYRTAIEELEWLIEDSVRLRTRSDVPYGLYYSGGIDSSLLNTFHDYEHKFTYQDKDYSEEFKNIFPKILWHLDYPISSFSAFGLWKLAEEASKKVKVVISGEGADELFGGYVRYVLPEFNLQAQKRFPSYRDMFQPAEGVHRACWREFNGNMRELLRMGDRMAGAWGVENRCPFLDRRIIEFAFSLPNYMKIQGLETKVILRRILQKRNPHYQDIEKKGLYCSVNKWIGSSEKFGKNDYRAYQQKIWENFLQ